MMVATAEYIAVVYVSTESIAAKAATTIVVTIEATIATTLELLHHSTLGRIYQLVVVCFLSQQNRRLPWRRRCNRVS